MGKVQAHTSRAHAGAQTHVAHRPPIAKPQHAQHAATGAAAAGAATRAAGVGAATRAGGARVRRGEVSPAHPRDIRVKACRPLRYCPWYCRVRLCRRLQNRSCASGCGRLTGEGGDRQRGGGHGGGGGAAADSAQRALGRGAAAPPCGESGWPHHKRGRVRLGDRDGVGVPRRSTRVCCGR